MGAAQAVQEAAAHARQAQVRLVAGPGTGKSSAIERRVCWLLTEGLNPADIAVVSFTKASVIDLRRRLHAYCHAHAHAAISHVSITTLHSLALRLLRQAGQLQMYPTRPLILDDWELENIYDAEFGEAQAIGSKRRREHIRRYYEALWSTGQDNAPTYQPPQPPITDEEHQQFRAFHQPTSQVYSSVLPGEIRTCNTIRAAVIETPQTSFRALFYDSLPVEVLPARAVTAIHHARHTCASISAWGLTDTLGDRRQALHQIVATTISEEAGAAWDTFAAALPDGMLLSELRDYIWADNAQQCDDVLRAVATRIGVNSAEMPPELDRVPVMTMHGAKGLSARVVFIPGLEEDLLPNRHQRPYPAQLLEATRLLYVSITRARAACILSFAQRRTVQGRSKVRVASRFAMHTGGAFEGRNGGLTDEETAVIGATLGDL